MGKESFQNWERKGKRRGIASPLLISSWIRQNAHEFLLDLHLPKGN